MLRIVLPMGLWALLVSGITVPDVPVPDAMAKVLPGKASPAPVDSRWVQVREHEIGGFRVTEVVLGRAHIDAELPMVVQFHGRASQPNVPEGDHTETPPVRLMLPWAPDRLGDGYTWYPLSITEGRDDKVLGHHIENRVAELAHVLKHFMYTRPTEGRPMVAGFSQGGMMTYGFAIMRPNMIDAAFPLAGWLPPYLVDAYFDETKSYPPIRGILGTEDPVVPLAGTQALVDELQDRGIDATLEVFETDEHELTAQAWARHKAQVRAMIRLRCRGAPNLG